MDLKDYLLKRISHADKRVSSIKSEHGDNPNETHTYYGGQSLGYWQGMLSAYQNVFDTIEKKEES